jgi:hypothetical protein
MRILFCISEYFSYKKEKYGPQNAIEESAGVYQKKNVDTG